MVRRNDFESNIFKHSFTIYIIKLMQVKGQIHSEIRLFMKTKILSVHVILS